MGWFHAVYDALFVDKLTRRQLTERVADLLVLSSAQLGNVYTRGPADINVDLTDSVSHLLLVYSY